MVDQDTQLGVRGLPAPNTLLSCLQTGTFPIRPGQKRGVGARPIAPTLSAVSTYGLVLGSRSPGLMPENLVKKSATGVVI